ncbi:MAG: DUF2254 domain-containing protein [Phycisphaeraceae bacterium]|nr:DUF2254 domain-containing protein [Phycisphaeraceae bacterium]
MHHLHQLWIRIASSLWFVPLVLVFGAIALALALILIDVSIGTDWVRENSLIFGVGAAGARGMLSAIAASMMTVASLSFSLTITTLATASSQYTSRLIRNFMRDRLNQFVLGYFVGLFAYCLIVLRTVLSRDEGDFVPPLAVFGGLVLALASIGVLIFFIHHIARSIQVSTILSSVTAETLTAVGHLFPDELGAPISAYDTAAVAPPPNATAWHPVLAERFGYVQSLNSPGLLAIAREFDCIIRMTADIGEFVTPAGTLCEIGLASLPDGESHARIRALFEIDSTRTIEQDAAFGIRQIVDIALKALSPGVNDTTTAVMCVHHLGVILEALGDRDIPDRLRTEDGVVRVLASGRSFDALAGQCLDQIRRCSTGNPAVMCALLNAVSAAGRRTSDPARRRTLSRHVGSIASLAQASLSWDEDLGPVRSLASRTAEELDAPVPYHAQARLVRPADRV